jgi:phosphoribosylformimino-5-aminoimidazole carboxamide ribotide isomerase
LVDLDGAKAKRIINGEVLRQIAKGTTLQVDFGGGVQSDEDIALAFSLGAYQVTGGSIAVKNPTLFDAWITRFGGEKIILGADAKDRKIAVSGWQETSGEEVVAFIKKYMQRGLSHVICTDVAKDGLLQGPSMDLYRDILSEIPGIKLIASGGVSTIGDLEKLRAIGVYGAIVGKAYYEGKITLEEIRDFGSD